MCGDLVSNHGTTGRASIERAEARPSYPILSFAWNHVGAGVVLVQTNPTQPTGLTLLRLHLRVSTDRSSSCSFAFHFLLRLLLFLHRLLLVLVLFLLHLLLLLLLLLLPLLLLLLPLLLCHPWPATHCYLPPSFTSI